MPSRAFSRYYVTRTARFTKLERAFLRGRVGDDAVDDFLLPTRYIEQEDFAEVFDERKRFQIVYNFSWAIRPNLLPRLSGRGFGPYGASGWSYRLLYEMLCNNYNNGTYFIDTYFESKFPFREIGRKYREANEELREAFQEEWLEKTADLPRRKDGVLPDMRYAHRGFRLKDFKLLRNPRMLEHYGNLAREIRQDIIYCLAKGELTRQVTEATARERERFGGMQSFSQLFYASGRLIEHLNVYINISGIPTEAA